LLDRDVVSGGPHDRSNIIRRRLVAGFARVPRRMPVGARISIGDRLEILHVIPEIVRLDALDELARGVVCAGETLRRGGGLGGCARARVGRREKCQGSDAEHRQPRIPTSRPHTLRHENLPPES